MKVTLELPASVQDILLEQICDAMYQRRQQIVAMAKAEFQATDADAGTKAEAIELLTALDNAEWILTQRGRVTERITGMPTEAQTTLLEFRQQIIALTPAQVRALKTAA